MFQKSHQQDFLEIFEGYRRLFESRFPELLKQTSLEKSPHEFKEAILYSLLSEGKKIRACLLLEVAHLEGFPQEEAFLWASAIECIHSYSLVHDDLPSMDDDDFRRGKPSSHKHFGEAIAILVGDCLQTLAFEFISVSEHSSSLLSYFSKAVGCNGLVGGQFLDIKTQSSKADFEQYQEIVYRKTAKLFEACVILPFLANKVTPPLGDALDKYRNWGKDLGMLFQIVDDIQDMNSSKTSHTASLNIIDYIGPKAAEKEVYRLESKLSHGAGKLFRGSVFLNGIPEYIVNGMK